MGFAGILIVVIVSFLVLCVVLAWLNDRSTKARKDVINAVLDAVNGMEHFQTDEHYFTEDFTTGIALDLERGKICLMRKELARMHTCVGDIEEVISCEVVITQGMPRTEGTSKTTGLLGGWLLGGIWGAVVESAVTGQRAVGIAEGVELLTVVADTRWGMHKVAFLSEPCDTASSPFRDALDQANSWKERIETLHAAVRSNAEGFSESRRR